MFPLLKWIGFQWYRQKLGFWLVGTKQFYHNEMPTNLQGLVEDFEIFVIPTSPGPNPDGLATLNQIEPWAYLQYSNMNMIRCSVLYKPWSW